MMIYQTASEALLSAAYYYIPEGVAKFSTFASKCIKNKLNRTYINKKTRRPKKLIDEISDVEYAETYTESLLYKHRYSNRTIYSISFYKKMISLLRKGIKELNADSLDLGQPDKVRSRIKTQNSKELLDNLYKLICELMKRSNHLISDEERELISLEAEMVTMGEEAKLAFMLKEYIALYEQKLRDIELYLCAESKLKDKNGDLDSQIEEIVKEMNRQVQIINSYRKDPECEFKRRSVFIDVYDKVFGVYLFALPHEPNSRRNEKRNIASNRISFADDCNSILNCLKDIQEDNPLEYIKIEMGYYQYSGLTIETIDYSTVDKDEEDAMPIKDAIAYLESLISETNDPDEYLKATLERRKQKVLKLMEKQNSEIFESNNAIKNAVLVRRRGKRRSLYDEEDVHVIERNIETLSGLDIELIERQTSSKQPKTSLEDEVIDRLFLEDYYKIINTLPSIQKNILYRWFDQNGKHSYSAQEIAKELGITQTEINREKDKAMRFLRKNPILNSYRD